MSDLVAFLTARLDEDEAAAKAAASGPWRWEAGDEGWTDNGPRLVSETATWMSPEGRGPYPTTVLGAWGHDAWGIDVEDADKAHIARHDPARVLREVEAKRKILAEHALMETGTWPPSCDRCWDGETAQVPKLWPCPTVRALAAVYSSHPDYPEDETDAQA